MGRGRQERRVPGTGRAFVGAREARPLTVHADAVIFDFDGTLVDSDEALAAPFVALGVEREAVTFGHVVADECARLGFTVEDYLSRYDPDAVQPFEGVDELLRSLPVPWAVCSNKVRRFGLQEMRRLGWEPVVAMFADDFGGPKLLEPVLAALELPGDHAVFVGDTPHDRECARAVGATFALAGWNPRAREAGIDADVLLERPVDLLGLF